MAGVIWGPPSTTEQGWPVHEGVLVYPNGQGTATLTITARAQGQVDWRAEGRGPGDEFLGYSSGTAATPTGAEREAVQAARRLA